MIHIKDEPIEFNDINDNFYTTKAINLEDILLNSFNDIEFNIQDKHSVTLNLNKEQFSLENVLQKFSGNKQKPKVNKLKDVKQYTQQSLPPSSQQQHQQQQQNVDQQQINNDTRLKEVYATFVDCEFDWLKVDEEEAMLNKLNKILDNTDNLNLKIKHDLNRYRCKLRLRKLKRLKRLKCFDIDTYTNELIDSETNSNCRLKYETASLNKSNDDIDIIAINRVLDRFDSPVKRKSQYQHNDDFYMVSIVEFRNDDVKCVISPYTNKLLKPYIRRDFESWPTKLKLHKELHDKYIILKNEQPTKFERHPIDYVYLRPEHVLPINNLCKKYFWNGIDVSECLQYPDYTCVALYRKIIIGFVFLVPNISYKEDYITFIFVQPNWRLSNIAKYMLYRVASINPCNDIVLHVSVNSSAVLFYQKFGFKIEEYIKQFYDKYYSDEENNFMSKDAFLMRLAR